MFRKILTIAVITAAALAIVPLHAAARAKDQSVVALECKRPREDQCDPEFPWPW